MPRDDRTFITVHDGMPEHDKIEGLSDAAFRLLISTWCWCSRNRTDGKVKQASWVKRGGARARKELVDAGLAEVTDYGVFMHDYLEHQRSSAEIDELSEKRRAAGSKGGKAKASATASARPFGKQTASKPVAETDKETHKDLRTSNGSPTVPAGFVPQVIRAYVESAKDADMPAPEDSQAKVDRSARKLLGEGYELAIVIETARNAAVNGWTDLSTQMQRDAARTTGATNGTTKSTTDQRAGDALALADRLEREQKAIAG